MRERRTIHGFGRPTRGGGSPRCRSRLRRVLDGATGRDLRAEVVSAPPVDGAAYRLKLAKKLSAVDAQRAAEVEAAEGALADLQQHPLQRQRMVLASRRDLHTIPVVDRLTEVSYRLIGDDPERAQTVAEMAVDVADRMDGERYPVGLVHDVRGRARRRLGNVQRRRSDLAGADKTLATAREILREGTGDPLERAELDNIEALLRKDQGNYEEALRINARAIRTFERHGSAQRAGIALINRAVVFQEKRESEAAVRTLLRASTVVDMKNDPRVAMMIYHNLALYLSDLGKTDAALGYLDRAEPLCAQLGTEAEHLRQHWVRGSIYLRQGALEGAVACLQIARDGFAAQGLVLEVAQISLEICLAYAALGKTLPAKRLAAQTATLFQSRGLARDVLAARTVLTQVAEAEVVTRALVERAIESIRRLTT